MVTCVLSTAIKFTSDSIPTVIADKIVNGIGHDGTFQSGAEFKV